MVINKISADSLCKEYESYIDAMSNVAACSSSTSANEYAEHTIYFVDANKQEYAFPNGAKNVVKAENDRIYTVSPNGLRRMIIPDIIDVRVVANEGESPVVTVMFADGTSEKAVLRHDDVFSLEYAISICITKRLLSGGDKNGSAIYNKIVRRGLKVYKNAKMLAEKEAAEEARIKAKIEKVARKKEARRKRREAENREYIVNILADAIRRANAGD